MGGLILTLLFILASAKFDAILINAGKYIDDHKSRWTFRFVVVALISLFDLYNFISLGLVFAALFDPTLNYFRNLGFWYLGTVAKWDLFFTKRLWLYKILRFTALIAGLTMYFYG